MKHSLKISVSDKPVSGGIVACRKVSLRKRVLDKLLGPEQKVTVIVPGQTVECISIKELAKAMHCSENRITGILFRTRKKLRNFLEKEGYRV